MPAKHAGHSVLTAPSTEPFYFLPTFTMGRMKELYTLLQETEQALQEYEPLAFENAKHIIEAAQAIAFASLKPRPRSIQPREDQTQIPA